MECINYLYFFVLKIILMFVMYPSMSHINKTALRTQRYVSDDEDDIFDEEVIVDETIEIVVSCTLQRFPCSDVISDTRSHQGLATLL